MPTHYAEIVQRYRPLAELVPAHWQAGSIAADDGAQIHYTRTGFAKPALLLLHGVQVSGLMWLRTAQSLESSYDVIMPDLRGHGQSSRVAPGLPSDQLVADMAALLRELGITRPLIAGHSLGADIAGRLAATHPTRAVVLVDPALRNIAAAMAFDPANPPPWLAPIMQVLEALKHQPHAERMLSGLRLLPPGTPIWHEADYVGFVEGQAQFDPTFFGYASALGYLFEEPTTIAQIDCPTLLLTARPMMPGADNSAGLAAFEQNWRTGRHVHFADSGHFIPFDQFERFDEVMRDFLAEQ